MGTICGVGACVASESDQVIEVFALSCRESVVIHTIGGQGSRNRVLVSYILTSTIKGAWSLMVNAVGKSAMPPSLLTT